MKINKIILWGLKAVLSIVTITQANAQTTNWDWAKGAGGSLSDIAKCVATDSSGNIYVAGSFSSTSISFGSYTLNNTSGGDVFFVKYDSKGTVLWAKSFSGSGKVTSIYANNFGNIYFAGYFGSPTIFFDSFILTNTRFADKFIVKCDLSGKVLWAKSGKEAQSDFVNTSPVSVTGDDSGSIYITGNFISSSIIFDNIVFTNTDGTGVYLVKYDSTGKVLWGIKTKGNSAAGASCITSDNSNNIYVAGSFGSQNITFGDTILINTGGNSNTAFLVKYDTAGNMLWARAKAKYGINSLTTDASGNIYITGSFSTGTCGGYWRSDTYLQKFNSSGLEVWVKNIGDKNCYDEVAYSVTADAFNNIFVTGTYTSPSITFGSYTLNNVHSESRDIFLVSYNPDGDVNWAKSIGGYDNEDVNSITTDDKGNVYLAGNFASPYLAFDSKTITNTSPGSNDMFIGKLSVITTGLENIENFNKFDVFPNPANKQLAIGFQQSANEHISLVMFDVTGRMVYSSSDLQKQINTSNFFEGIYVLKIISNNFIETRKVVVKH